MTGLLKHPRQDALPLNQNAAHGYAARHALVHFPSGAIYSFIPKNACSTLRVSLAIAHGCIVGPEEWTWIHTNNKTFQAELRDLVCAPYSFVVLRCPHARLASVFLDKIVGKYPTLWELLWRVDGGFDPDAITFREFVGLMRNPKYRKMNPHWRPQSDFLVYDDYSHWIALERFSEAAPRLQSDIGLKVVDARALTRHGQDHLTPSGEAHCADMPAAEIAAMKRAGQSPTYASLYDPQLREVVRRAYAADYDLYTEKFGTDDLLFPELN